jgi:hypothetical protein
MTMMTTLTKWVDNHDEEDPPQGGEICKEGQGKEEGLASAEVVHHAAVQVHDGDVAFLLMAEARVATAAVSLSTVALGASSSLGGGTMTIILGLLSPQHAPDDDGNKELAQELVGTQQWEQRHGTPCQWRRLLVWATFGLDFHH